MFGVVVVRFRWSLVKELSFCFTRGNFACGKIYIISVTSRENLYRPTKLEKNISPHYSPGSIQKPCLLFRQLPIFWGSEYEIYTLVKSKGNRGNHDISSVIKLIEKSVQAGTVEIVSQHFIQCAWKEFKRAKVQS